MRARIAHRGALVEAGRRRDARDRPLVSILQRQDGNAHEQRDARYGHLPCVGPCARRNGHRLRARRPRRVPALFTRSTAHQMRALAEAVILPDDCGSGGGGPSDPRQPQEVDPPSRLDVGGGFRPRPDAAPAVGRNLGARVRSSAIGRRPPRSRFHVALRPKARPNCRRATNASGCRRPRGLGARGNPRAPSRHFDARRLALPLADCASALDPSSSSVPMHSPMDALSHGDGPERTRSGSGAHGPAAASRQRACDNGRPLGATLRCSCSRRSDFERALVPRGSAAPDVGWPTERSAARRSKPSSAEYPRARMISFMSSLAFATAARGSSMNWLWMLVQLDVKRARSASLSDTDPHLVDALEPRSERALPRSSARIAERPFCNWGRSVPAGWRCASSPD